ncbi:MAG: DUF4900 domain-containing protein [Candidatus Omnitrophota bacterium]|nr:DUF4900 domain-containing protein [Candidatus Omnitrophota bacterium]
MIKNRKGIALAISFLVIIVLVILGSVFILRSVGEKNAADKEKKSIQAFYLGEAGANEALNRLVVLINSDLMLTVNSTNPQVLANNVRSYVNSSDGLVFLANYTKENNTPQFICPQNCSNCQNCTFITYNGQITNFGQGNYQYIITVNENGNPTTITTDVWDFPYNYKISSTGTVAGIPRKIISSGDFTVRVQHDNFARYALFDVHHTTPGGDAVWFTSRTNFSGPVHTNDQYRFYGNPNSVPVGISGTFEGLVTQHLNKAWFYNLGSPFQADQDSNPGKDVPVLNAGFQRGVNEINLESSVTQQDLMNQAQGGVGGSYADGIYVNNDGSNVIGGIYIKGNSTIEMGKDVNENATYNIVQGGSNKIITVDYVNNQTTVQTAGGPTNVYNGKPDGIDNLGTIIYADGAVDSLKGTVQKDSQVTVSSQGNIIITDHIMYEDYNPAQGVPGQPGYVPPNAEGKTNLLGILSWGGDVNIGTSSPNDINLHGTMMARNGIFTVESYSSRCNSNPSCDSQLPSGGCGAATLLGGAITNFYGAFGTFCAGDGRPRSGYGRNFVYDERMAQGNAPPYFPSMRTFIALTPNDTIKDKITWQEGGQ